MRQFLNENRLTIADFSGDRATERRLDPQFKLDRRLLGQAADNQVALYGGDRSVKRDFKRQAKQLRERQQAFTIGESIRETMDRATQDPDAFREGVERSQSAKMALDDAPYERGGVLSGLVAGGVSGGALGRLGARANKVNPAFFGPVGAVAGAGIGLLGGRLAGRAVNEKVTGRDYDEVRAPYEIARGLRDGAE